MEVWGQTKAYEIDIDSRIDTNLNIEVNTPSIIFCSEI